MRKFERNRQAIIRIVSGKLEGVDDSRPTDMVRTLLKRYKIPATNQDIENIVNEAIRRRMVERIKTTRDQLIALNNKVNQLHGINQ